MSQHTFQIQLEGLITLLAKNLYADPDVFLREMLQNAHDSITKRRALKKKRGEKEIPAGLIRIEIDARNRTLEIHDNGAGMTEAELHDHLATIGRSGTGELRSQLHQADRTQAIDLIGQFGIGLLSAFIVAARVEASTRAPGGEALHWVSTGDRNYEVQPGTRAGIGTTMILHLRPEHSRYLDAERLKQIVRTYADFIGIPVHIGDDPDPINAVHAPWDRKWSTEREQRVAYTDFWENRFLHEKSLDILVVDVTFDFTSTETGELTRGRVRGVLGITDRHTPDVNTRGTVDLYIARMFICSGNREVLPPWARFIQGVIECDALTPNAARDNVVRNAALVAVQQALGDLVIRHLTELSLNEPRRLTEIMRWHSYHVLAMCTQDEHEGFFRAVADLVPLDTDQGPLTVPAYLRDAPTRTDGPRQVYYISERGMVTQYYMLCAARGLRVFNCSENFAEEFLKRYAAVWPERMHLTRLDLAGSDAIFEPLRDDAERHRFRDIEATYASIFPDLRCIARVGRFKPVDVPALLTETRDNRSRHDMENAAGNVALPPYLRTLLGNYLKDQRETLTLHLNADNPVIQRLAGRGAVNDEVSRESLAALYNNALLLRARSLRPEDVRAMFTQHNRVLELMLTLHDRLAIAERTIHTRDTEIAELRHAGDEGIVPTPYVSCFVALPYKNPQADAVFAALRRVLEDLPYCWRLIRADDSVERPGLWENVKVKLQRAHCFIAEASEHNPNVMIEVGRMEALGRPVLYLRRRGSLEMPADLRGILHGEYAGSDEGELVEELRGIVERQQLFIDQKGERFLSAAVLQSAGINDEICRKLAVKFDTWAKLLAASPEEVGRQIGVRKGLVEAAQEALRERTPR